MFEGSEENTLATPPGPVENGDISISEDGDVGGYASNLSLSIDKQAEIRSIAGILDMISSTSKPPPTHLPGLDNITTQPSSPHAGEAGGPSPFRAGRRSASYHQRPS